MFHQRRRRRQANPIRINVEPVVRLGYASKVIEEEAEAIHPTKPITAWKKRWFVKNDKGDFAFKSRQAIVKLRSLANVYDTYLSRMEQDGLYDYDDMILQVVHAMEVHDEVGNRLVGVNSEILGADLGTVSGSGEVTFEFGSVPLLDGTYAVSVGIHTLDSSVEYDHRDQLDRFSVVSGARVQGRVHFDLSVVHLRH